MDPNEIRRKRLKLFGSASPPPPPAPPANPYAAKGTSASPIDVDMDMDEDERMARELQKQFDQGHSDGPPASALSPEEAFKMATAADAIDTKGTTEDEKMAYELQKQLNQESDWADSLAAANENGGTMEIPGWPGLQADDWSISHDGAPQPPQNNGRRGKKSRKPNAPEMVPIIAEELDTSDDAIEVRKFGKRIHMTCGGCGRDDSEDLRYVYLDQTITSPIVEEAVRTSPVPNSLEMPISLTHADNPLWQLVNAYISKTSMAVGAGDFGSFCTYCRAHTCLGCGERLTQAGGLYKATYEGGTLAWHCDRGRMVLIWLILCAHDVQATHNKPKKRAPPPPTKKVPQPRVAPTRGRGRGGYRGRFGRGRGTLPAGIGYGSEGYGSTGAWYGDADDDDDPMSDESSKPYDEYDDGDFDSEEEYNGMFAAGQSLSGRGRGGLLGSRPGRKLPEIKKKPVKFDPDDAITTRTMAALAVLLPSVESNEYFRSTMDYEPPKSLTSLLLRSSLIVRAAELLRNDSIEEASGRTSLYTSLFNFVRALANHEATNAVTVHGALALNNAGHDLLRVTSGLPTRVGGEKLETGQSIASSLQNLAIQSQTMLDAAAKSKAKDFEAEETQQMLLLCRNLVDLSEFLQANAVTNTNGHVENTTPRNDSKIEQDLSWQSDLAMLEVPDEVILDSSIFGAEARKLTDPPSGRMRHLIKEITMLKTSLPPGIFVRYGSSRLDVMKVLIIGPQGTPYENGLFEFDLICSINFPAEPPKMTFRTTGGGIAHFNPNLYPCGKVCLSLLGTWSGEPWRPGKSTILQILISLQAMVLCDEPHCNEPGCEYDRGSQQSKMYNRRIYPLTVKHAMVDWIEKKEDKPPSRKERKLGGSLPPGLGSVRLVPEGHTLGGPPTFIPTSLPGSIPHPKAGPPSYIYPAPGVNGQPFGAFPTQGALPPGWPPGHPHAGPPPHLQYGHGIPLGTTYTPPSAPASGMPNNGASSAASNGGLFKSLFSSQPKPSSAPPPPSGFIPDLPTFTPGLPGLGSAMPPAPGHYIAPNGSVAAIPPPPMPNYSSRYGARSAKSSHEIWKDVVEKHFAGCQDGVLKVVDAWVKDKAPPPRNTRSKKNGPIPNFNGTGWGGRALGETTTPNAPAAPMAPKPTDFVGKLKGALRELEQNRNLPHYPHEEMEEDYEEEWEGGQKLGE